MHNVGPVHI